MKIQYGTKDVSIDVTDICLTKLLSGDILFIPSTDMVRASFFTDPIYGTLKTIFVLIDDDVLVFDHTCSVHINLKTNKVSSVNAAMIDLKVAAMHSSLKLYHGSFEHELPEQKMAVRYLTGSETVLEIGANIGRNTLMIAKILGEREATHLVTMECDNGIANQLQQNRDENGFKFRIERSALSKRKLIQRGWDTKPSEELLEGYKWVNTIDSAQLKAKYNDIQFDTLVLDCEGAFYYILMDMPEILDNISLIIMENDYHTKEPKEFVNSVLEENNFVLHYVECGGWGPCYQHFFEVWKRM